MIALYRMWNWSGTSPAIVPTSLSTRARIVMSTSFLVRMAILCGGALLLCSINTDDHSRVVLSLQDNTPGSDYINSSFIDVSRGRGGGGQVGGVMGERKCVHMRLCGVPSP